MKYYPVDSVTLPVPAIVFGCAIPIMQEGRDASALLDAVYGAGITAFDTAEIYAGSEASLGAWIERRGLRDKVTVITKGCHPHLRSRLNWRSLRRDIEHSLQNLRTDRIDIYFLHRDVPGCDLHAVLDMLNEYHAAGKSGLSGDRTGHMNESPKSTGTPANTG